MTEQTVRNPDWRAAHGFLLVGLVAGTIYVPALRGWPQFWLAPLAAYLSLVRLVPPLWASFAGWRFGRVTGIALVAAVTIAAVSCGALLVFQAIAQPDLHAYAKLFPHDPWGGIWLWGVGFAVVNALIEEIVFRGILFDAVESQLGGWGAVLVTATLFGLGHLGGYPPGISGAILAGIYGLALGGLRLWTGGIGLTFAAHIVADATIFMIVVQSGVLAK